VIITRTPFRLSFCGGMSDLPGFYSHGIPGQVIGAAINKYMYITVNERFENIWRLCYSRTEEAPSFTHFHHELARECLKHTSPWSRALEIHSTADVPAGTGLGSSSAYTVGFLKALHHVKGQTQPRQKLAAEACYVEIDRCKKPIGKQDQYLTALGGIQHLMFHADETVSAAPVLLGDDGERDFLDHLLLLYTGCAREASPILALQSAQMDHTWYRRRVGELALFAEEFRTALTAGDWLECGLIMDESWAIKRNFAHVTNSVIDDAYGAAMSQGAVGGKICGAGNGGFLLFVAPPETHQQIVAALKLEQLKFKFDRDGSTLIYRSEDLRS
jgi:D-glycero-alpha-D-manno-heptose-7-phosphate kinase